MHSIDTFGMESTFYEENTVAPMNIIINQRKEGGREGERGGEGYLDLPEI